VINDGAGEVPFFGFPLRFYVHLWDEFFIPFYGADGVKYLGVDVFSESLKYIGGVGASVFLNRTEFSPRPIREERLLGVIVSLVERSCIVMFVPLLKKFHTGMVLSWIEALWFGLRVAYEK